MLRTPRTWLLAVALLLSARLASEALNTLPRFFIAALPHSSSMSVSKSFELPPDFDQIDRILFHNLQVAHNDACILPLVRALRKAGLRKVSDWTAPKAWAMLRPHFIGDAPTLEASIMMQCVELVSLCISHSLRWLMICSDR